jgi:REP-associated tyrosine transposase
MFQRKNIRLQRSNYIGLGWCFFTTCTERRVPRLQDPRLFEEHLTLLRQSASKQSVAVHAYCFMPDHLHILVSGTRETSDCLAFINGFKQCSAFAFKQRTGERLWQHKPYDHILRSHERWESVAYYIWMNPVRRGLCNRPEEWPFSGSETVDWRRLLTTPRELWVPPWKPHDV